MNKRNVVIGVLIALLFLSLGFYSGKSFVQIKTRIEYKTLPPLTDTIFNLKPYRSALPDIIFYPLVYTIIDSVTSEPKIDTQSILKDFITINDYSTILFDSDTLGKLTVNSTIQYNALQAMSYLYEPVQKNVVNYKVNHYTPFVSIHINTLGFTSANVGLFNRNIGFSLNYATNIQRHGLGFGLHLKLN